jgi:hypothetical protein
MNLKVKNIFFATEVIGKVTDAPESNGYFDISLQNKFTKSISENSMVYPIGAAHT